MFPALLLGLQFSQPKLLLPTVEGDRYTFGERTGWKVTGLSPRDIIEVSLTRVETKYVQRGQAWNPIDVGLRAWAVYRANDEGVVAIDNARPIRGTYRRPDAAGLLWSGRVEKKPPQDPPGTFRISVKRGAKLIGASQVRFREGAPGVALRDVAAEVRGAFALPKGTDKVPVVIYLHGSEGSSLDGARSNAARFAARGIACFALHYSARPWVQLEGTRTDAVNIPIEIIDQVRTWLATEPRVDMNRIGLYGVSKGAELSLVAGTKYDWIKSIVAVVPSDVVYEGYGRDLAPDEVASSWSWKGDPLPYVPYIKGYFEANPGSQATAWHRKSREITDAPRVEKARIPVEEIRANTLLIAGDLDEIWPSGAMARTVEARMKRANRKVQALVFPRGNHQLSGPGAFPTWLFANDPLKPEDANPIDVGEATREAWSRAIRHLKNMK